ncbi:MAG TPA: AcrB/AcrD/AcrF family protein [Sphingomonas sp.]|nr:AcrB/AcrD/AcrF family protein [Sphingomonas sp.]
MLSVEPIAREEAPSTDAAARFERLLALRWKLVTLIFWIGAAAVLLWMKRAGIHWFALPDTDDNIRFNQVRDWLHGQGWYDLRQYRLNPPIGFNIHWSRLVDLPIAAMIVTLKPIFGAQIADRVAVAVAPLLALLPAMLALSAVVRRLVDEQAYPLALAILMCAGGAVAMWTPLRIDHHGWQLAFLMITVSGLIDRDPVRSGMTIAVSTALSTAIGLEMLPYTLFAGAALGLHWAWDRREAKRLGAYGVTMAAAITLCFLVFTSYDNMAMRCDALTPIWYIEIALGAVLLALLSRVKAESRWARLALVLAAGGIVVAVMAIAFPQCLDQRLEGISPEVERLWLSHVREARPIYKQSVDVILGMTALPVIGAIGSLIALWKYRGARQGADWLPVTLFVLFAGLLMLWQTRTGPSAQMLAVPGATWLAWAAILWLGRSRFLLVRVVGPVAAFLILSGIFAPYLHDGWNALAVHPAKNRPATKTGRHPVNLTSKANAECPTIPALAPIGKLPAATLFSFIDLGPRIITLTHHSAVAGPYHRNGDAILDVEHAFRGSPEQAHAIIDRHHASYVLICPHMSEATIYRAEAPGGFYSKLASGWTPAWLHRMPLPKDSPYVLYRVAD